MNTFNMPNVEQEQECIPVGCVPAAHWPYAGVCFRGGGVCSRGIPKFGVSALGGGVCLLWGGESALGGSALGGWSAPRGGVCSGGNHLCLLQGCLPLEGCVYSWGVSAPRGGVASQHALRQTPPCEQNDKQVQKYYLGHNFVAAGNDWWGTDHTYLFTKCYSLNLK